MPNIIGDLAFPDNPKRRERAAQLHDDCVAFGAQFQQLHSKKALIVANLKPQVDAHLKKLGISTPEELEAKVTGALNSEALKNYRETKASLNASDSFQVLLSGIVDIAAVGSGVIITVAAIAGIMSGGAALAVAGEILAILGAILVVIGVVEGAEERARLRDAIQELYPKRIQIRQALGQLDAVINWLGTIETWINTMDVSQPELVNNLIIQTLKKEYSQWEDKDHTINVLNELDKQRGSWTNEDPPFHAVVIPPKLLFPDPISTAIFGVVGLMG